MYHNAHRKNHEGDYHAICCIKWPRDTYHTLDGYLRCVESTNGYIDISKRRNLSLSCTSHIITHRFTFSYVSIDVGYLKANCVRSKTSDQESSTINIGDDYI